MKILVHWWWEMRQDRIYQINEERISALPPDDPMGVAEASMTAKKSFKAQGSSFKSQVGAGVEA
jgi:hypothetical protein